MGYKLVTLLLLSLIVWGNSQYLDIDRLIEKVKVKREGLSHQEIKRLKNPFISEKKLVKIIEKTQIATKKAKKRISYKLYSIFGKRAKINGRWYKLGSKVGGYRLVAIGDNSVVLRSRAKELRLYLTKRKRKRIKFYDWSRE